MEFKKKNFFRENNQRKIEVEEHVQMKMSTIFGHGDLNIQVEVFIEVIDFIRFQIKIEKLMVGMLTSSDCAEGKKEG